LLQTLLGVSATEFVSSSVYSLTIQETVAQIVFLTYESISVTTVTSLGTDSIAVVYLVSSVVSPLTLTESEAAITLSIIDGDFSEIMNENAVANGATGLAHAKADTAADYLVPTGLPSVPPTPKPSLPPVRLPTLAPTYIMADPTPKPTARPSKQPGVPTRQPTYQVSTAFSVSQVTSTIWTIR
jgi:hypothetical protein